MEYHLKIVGTLLLLLALLHALFPWYFNWKDDLRSLSLINRQMMKVHTFFIAFAVFLMGLLSVTCSGDLVHTDLGKRITSGLAIFWTVRLIIQFFGYSSELWKGKIFETVIHLLFILLWSYFCWVYWVVAICR